MNSREIKVKYSQLLLFSCCDHLLICHTFTLYIIGRCNLVQPQAAITDNIDSLPDVQHNIQNNDSQQAEFVRAIVEYC